MAKEKGKTVEMTERDPAPIPIDPREESGQATPQAVHGADEAKEAVAAAEDSDQVALLTVEPAVDGSGPKNFNSIPVEQLAGSGSGKGRKSVKGVAVGDTVEYCVGYRNAGVDKDGNSLTEPVYTTAKVLEVDNDHPSKSHIRLVYRGVDGYNFDAWAHHFAGRPGYWQLAGEKPSKDDE